MIAFEPTLNSILMIIVGSAMIVFAIFLVFTPYTRVFAVGLLLTGFGNVLFGLTNGFTDMTPVGRLLYRIALVAYLLGVPIIGYFFYREMR